MKRTKLSERPLPTYTAAEERLHMISHIAGAALGLFALITLVCRAAARSDGWGITGGFIYGIALILLYTTSSIYHGLHPGMGKQVMRILDHCTINFLIAGTYTPILFCSIRPVSSFWAWIIFAIVWGFAVIATIFTAIDLKRYGKFAMACYIGMGWSILLAAKTAIEAIPTSGLLYLLFGGITYTLGACLYGIGKKHRYFHFIFHLFVVLASILQFICVYFYVL